VTGKDQAPFQGKEASPSSRGTKDAILDAARAEFARGGYGGATIRVIAATAGVDPALVIHYFGSKDALFGATLQMPGGVADRMLAVFDGPREQLARRLVSTYLGLWEDPQTGPMLRSVTRSAMTNPVAADVLRGLIEGTVIAAAASVCPPERLNLAAAQLYGIAFARYVLRTGPVASLGHQELVELVTPQIQLLLNPV
jgi:AcrR family transcriptional regulator